MMMALPTGMIQHFPFDAHNHVHMGETNAMVAMLRPGTDINNDNNNNNNNNSNGNNIIALGGMALMSTHPRDYSKVLDLCYHTLPQEVNQVYYNSQQQQNRLVDDNNGPHPMAPVFIPCLGVHPWFVSELSDDDWQLVDHENGNENSSETNGGTEARPPVPRWIHELEQQLLMTPQPSMMENQQEIQDDSDNKSIQQQRLHPPPPIVVGEIGLDKFQFHPDTKKLLCPMDIQLKAFQYQLEVATRLERPVSVHCVHAIGKIIEILQLVQRSHKKLPPKIYFHAFGGKEATVDQLIVLAEKKSTIIHTTKKKKEEKEKNNKSEKNHHGDEKRNNNDSEKKKENDADHDGVAFSSSTSSSPSQSSPSSSSPKSRLYFGFAPIINFRSPKTATVVQKVGINRLVLETDHEDASRVPDSMEHGIDVLSKILQIDRNELITRTTANAMDLYGISSSSSSS